MRKLLMGLSALALLAGSTPAHAAPGYAAHAAGATMDRDLSIWGLAGYSYGAGAGYGLGGRYQAVIAPRGILRSASVKDEIGLEFGLDWLHYSWGFYGYNWTYNEISPVLGLTWNFWLNDRLALYPKLDVGFRFGSWSDNAGFTHPGGYGGFGVEGALGLVFRIDPRIALRVEAGSYAFRLGLAFKI